MSTAKPNRTEKLAKGLLPCGHDRCIRPAVQIVGMVDENNTLGQTHDCCGHHGRCGK